MTGAGSSLGGDWGQWEEMAASSKWSKCPANKGKVKSPQRDKIINCWVSEQKLFISFERGRRGEPESRSSPLSILNNRGYFLFGNFCKITNVLRVASSRPLAPLPVRKPPSARILLTLRNQHLSSNIIHDRNADYISIQFQSLWSQFQWTITEQWNQVQQNWILNIIDCNHGVRTRVIENSELFTQRTNDKYWNL